MTKIAPLKVAGHGPRLSLSTDDGNAGRQYIRLLKEEGQTVLDISASPFPQEEDLFRSILGLKKKEYEKGTRSHHLSCVQV